METKSFLHQIKRTNGTYDKGIVVKDTVEGGAIERKMWRKPEPEEQGEQ